MSWVAEVNEPKHIKGVIEEDRLLNVAQGSYETAYNLYIYENKNQFDSWDYSMGTLESAMQQALEQFKIPINAWQPKNLV